tara:strand:- start:45047 stop:45250 length:204 start_codon:yes stop_codon:yes gene_type:complete
LFVLDEILELSFYQDWSWHSPLVLTAFYFGLQGYSQPQPKRILFSFDLPKTKATPELKIGKVLVQKE